MEATQAEAEVLIDEIAHKIALPAVRTVAAVLRSALVKILDAIYVNEDGLKAVRLFLTTKLDTARFNSAACRDGNQMACGITSFSSLLFGLHINQLYHV